MADKQKTHGRKNLLARKCAFKVPAWIVRIDYNKKSISKIPSLNKISVNTLNKSYHLLDLLGRSSMGEVYRTYDRLTGEQVALKDKCYTLAGLHPPRLDSLPAHGEKTP
jgi:hypothetical protein